MIIRIVLAASALALVTMGTLQAEETKTTKEPVKLKYYLMIAEPNSEAWKGVIMEGGDMAEPAGKALEAMGGKLLNYYIGVGEAKNYGVVAFPDSMDIAKIVYMRTAQGVMKDIQFIEIIPSDQAVDLFKETKKLLEPQGK